MGHPRDTTLLEQPLNSLPRGAEVTLRSMRDWLYCCAQGHCVFSVLEPRYDTIGCPNGALLIDEMMTLLRFAARRPIHFERVESLAVSADEARMLAVLRGADGGDPAAASMALNRLLRGPLSRCFCRISSLYTGELRAAGLKLNGLRGLHAVTRSDGPHWH